MRRFNSLSTFNMSFVLLAAPESCQLAIWINAKEPEQSDIDNDTVFCPAGVYTPLSAGSAKRFSRNSKAFLIRCFILVSM